MRAYFDRVYRPYASQIDLPNAVVGLKCDVVGNDPAGTGPVEADRCA